MLTPESRRGSFPTLERMTYFNTAAEGIPPLEVGDALAEYFRDKQTGMDGRGPHFAALDEMKALTASWFGLTPAEVGFCSCASEAYNLAALALRLREGDEVVINDLDFPAGATPWLQPTCPATVRIWRSRQGRLDPHDLVELIGPKTRFVTLSLVSFFNGFLVDLPAVRDIVRRRSNALLSVDVTQALGRIPLDLTDVDLIVSSTHKWILAGHGGGLVGVPRNRDDAWTIPAGGWFHLQNAFDADRFDRAVSKPGAAGFGVGMPNFPAAYMVRAALKYLGGIGVEAIDRHARPLTLECLKELHRLPIEMLTPDDPTAVAGILAFRHPQAEQLHARLHSAGIHVMCSAGRVRIAVHGYNSADDVDHLLRTLRSALSEV